MINGNFDSQNPFTTEPSQDQAPTVSQPSQRPRRKPCRQVWPLSPEIRAAMIDNLSQMTERGATIEDRDQNGRTFERNVTPRENLRSMRLLHTFTRLNLNQQKLDLDAEDHVNRGVTLNDCVTVPVETAGERMAEEAEALGLDCAAALPPERVEEIYEQAEQEYIALKGKLPAPEPFAEIPSDQRNDWFIPVETQARIMNRLADMALPSGQEYHEIRPRERFMAYRVLAMFCSVVDQQQRLDRKYAARGPADDWDELEAEMEKREAHRLVERRREAEEFEMRLERRRREEKET
jgi:hypothetical protein